jgi:hypothetical protein
MKSEAPQPERGGGPARPHPHLPASGVSLPPRRPTRLPHSTGGDSPPLHPSVQHKDSVSDRKDIVEAHSLSPLFDALVSVKRHSVSHNVQECITRSFEVGQESVTHSSAYPGCGGVGGGDSPPLQCLGSNFVDVWRNAWMSGDCKHVVRSSFH